MNNLPIYIRVQVPPIGEQWDPNAPYTECELLDFLYDGGYGMKCRSTIIVRTPDGSIREMRELSEHKQDRHKLFEFLEEKRNAEFLYEQTHFKGKSLDEQHSEDRCRRGRADVVHYNHLVIRVYPKLSCGSFRAYPATPKRIRALDRIAQLPGYKCTSLRENVFVDEDEDWEDCEEIDSQWCDVPLLKVKTNTKVIKRVYVHAQSPLS